jgi:hypothetical protein
MKTTIRTALTFGVCCAVALTLPAFAQEEDDGPTEEELVAIATDPKQDLYTRATSLKKARSLVYKITKTPRTGPLREAIGPLVQSLGSKADHKEYARLNATSLQSLKPFTPFPDIATLVLPFLAEGVPLRVRIEALVVIRDHGAQGLEKTLVTMLNEDQPRRVKERFTLTIVGAAKSLPPSESSAVIAKALNETKFRTVKLAAARALGDVRTSAGKKALLGTADASNRDEYVSSAAALSLLQFGSLEGIGQLVKRLVQRKGRSQTLYKAICRGAHKEDSGFLDVPHSRYYQVPREERVRVVEAVAAWWKEHEQHSVEDLMFSELRAKLKAQGVTVPTSRGAKETVDALIAGLGVLPLSLRYAALALLVELTGRDDLASDFRSILITLGKHNVKMREWEPTYGFEDPSRRNQLLKEQKQKAEKWRAWWESAKDQATWDGKKWAT